ncbi:hypothetical protein [Sphingomonas japonica]|uniref:Phage replication protein O n=1 Tax=Sphingomonas japonica TaxID=511662 RepID=A0ABX0U445_9SPHN|nr:hypothetical protein [Sphingomonas japonica]NIJ24820.1 hypothetical protein [Sphingomonas japonica]
MSGYACFHRSLVGHPAFRNDAEAMAFAYMVLRASWKPTRVRYKGRAVDLKRGQLSISQRDMATALDRDKAWVERLWKRLRDEGMIALKNEASPEAGVGGAGKARREAGPSVITICNYDKYQHSNDEREAPNEAGSEAEARQAQGTEQVREKGKKEDTLPSGSVAHARKADPFPRPDWADPQVWSDFLANRRKKRLTNTPTAHKGFLADIARNTDECWPPGRLLEVATRKGHGAIYPSIKDGDNGRQQHHSNGRSASGYGATVDAAELAMQDFGYHRH